uniref:Uncharacterized protein n=1 Tax=Trichobilharzia regenti TaxID=157069 RepID=A0AA85IYB5_TRIRE|nr:unnamed protein product [Trichobilharzia regenti]
MQSDNLSEKICYEVAEYIVGKSFDTAFKIYLTNQLIPFVVHQASSSLSQLVNLEFMCCDPGEPCITTSSEWREDEVADSCRIDSWAQGAISKSFHTKLLEEVTKNVGLCQSVGFKLSDRGNLDNYIGCNTAKEEINGNVCKPSDMTVKSETKPQRIFLNKHQKCKPIGDKCFILNRNEKLKELNLTPHKEGLSNEVGNLSVEDESANNKQENNTIKKKRIVKPAMKLVPDATLLSKQISGSGRLVFDNEGNLISVPKLYPIINNKQSESTVITSCTELTSNLLGKKIPIQWYFRTDSLVHGTQNQREPTSSTNNSIRNKTKTARSSVSSTTGNKRRQRNRSLESTEYIVDPEMIRLQKMKNSYANIPNATDLVDLVLGVTVSDGDHLKIGRFVNDKFSSLLNINWDGLEEIPSVKAN